MKHPDATSRLQELSEAYALPDAAAGQLATILDEMVAEHASITTVRDPAQGVERHVEDALTALGVPAVRNAATIADLGAGAGFPGFALAAAMPNARVRLVESVERKCAFLERAAGLAGLSNVSVVWGRAEAWEAGHGANDVITARALASLPVLVEYAAPLLAPGGTLVAWKGRLDREEQRAGDEAAAIVGLSPHAVVDLPSRRDGRESVERRLYLYVKVGPTPDRFPRRIGVARKRPLAG